LRTCYRLIVKERNFRIHPTFTAASKFARSESNCLQGVSNLQ